ncbi:Aerobic glycerol-3-phosphate dehydrogenase [Thalassocella blandensis]|nr:Aerobic glycerol-3-phosphate dehydrogenase [Thalassocella blandensis]
MHSDSSGVASKIVDARQTGRDEFDLAILGTGFHGVSIAREASRLGLKVVLLHDQTIIDSPCAPYHAVLGADIGKLESLNFTQVIANQQALLELHTQSPHLIHTIPVFISHNGAIRSARRVKFGIRAYRSLQKKGRKTGLASSQPDKLSADRLIGLNQENVFPEHVNEFTVHAKRLLIKTAQEAIAMGVEDRPYHFVKQGVRSEKNWQLTVIDKQQGDEKYLYAKALVNCASSAIDSVLQDILKVKTRCQSKVIQCAWLYINKPQQWPFGLMLQLNNKTLPYVFSASKNTLCVGPIIVESDQPMEKQLAINNVLEELNNTTAFNTTVDDIVRCEWHTESIFDDINGRISDAYNEAYLDLNNAKGLAPVLSIFGTNIAQSNKVARESLTILQTYFPQLKDLRHNTPTCQTPTLLSKDLTHLSELEIQHFLWDKYPLLNEKNVMRMYHTYGTAIQELLAGLEGCTDIEAMGEHFGHGLYAREVDYLVQHEWVNSVEDILWRNTYFGLVLDARQRQALTDYLAKCQSHMSI